MVDLDRALPAIRRADAPNRLWYSRALALLRLHTQPLGLLDLELPAEGVSSRALSDHIWAALGDRISKHLRDDGLPLVAKLSPQGIPVPGTPTCLLARERLLADAPFVSVVIATCDRAESLAACLAALGRLHYPHYEVIVVDNGRTTAAADLVDRGVPELIRLRYARADRPNTSGARNLGLALARGEIIACIDDDAVPDVDWLAALVGGFAAGTNVGCVTGLIVPSELDTPAQMWFEQFGGFGKGFTRRIYDLDGYRPDDPLFPYAAGRFGSGPNMAFRADALKVINGFDCALGGGSLARGGEDLAAYFQVIVAGYQLVYEPAAVVFHAHRREYEALRRQIFGYGLGLSAFLTKAIVAYPRLLPRFCRGLLPGVSYALSPRSPKNRKKASDYPGDLTRAEMEGMICGPFAYFLGRLRESARRISLPLSGAHESRTRAA